MLLDILELQLLIKNYNQTINNSIPHSQVNGGFFLVNLQMYIVSQASVSQVITTYTNAG